MIAQTPEGIVMVPSKTFWARAWPFWYLHVQQHYSSLALHHESKSKISTFNPPHFSQGAFNPSQLGSKHEWQGMHFKQWASIEMKRLLDGWENKLLFWNLAAVWQVWVASTPMWMHGAWGVHGQGMLHQWPATVHMWTQCTLSGWSSRLCFQYAFLMSCSKLSFGTSVHAVSAPCCNKTHGTCTQNLVVILCLAPPQYHLHITQLSVGEVRSGPVPGHFCWTGDWTVQSLTKILGLGPGPPRTVISVWSQSRPGPDLVQTWSLHLLFIYLFKIKDGRLVWDGMALTCSAYWGLGGSDMGEV